MFGGLYAAFFDLRPFGLQKIQTPSRTISAVTCIFWPSSRFPNFDAFYAQKTNSNTLHLSSNHLDASH